MNSYGDKVTQRQPIDFGLVKTQIGEIDYDDIKNRQCNERSDFGKLVAYKQSQIQNKAKGIKKYLTEAFKGMKHVRLASKRE